MASRISERVPGWVERMLIPTIESRIRSIVKAEVAHLENVMDARFEAIDEKLESRFEAMDEKLESRFETLDAKIDSLEKRFPVVQDLAEIKARLAQVEKNQR